MTPFNRFAFALAFHHLEPDSLAGHYIRIPDAALPARPLRVKRLAPFLLIDAQPLSR